MTSPSPVSAEDRIPSGDYTWSQQSSDTGNSAYVDADAGPSHPSIDPRRITPTLNASLVTEILNLRRELDRKNASIDELEEGLHASNTEVESAKARLSRLTRETATQQKQFDDTEKHLHRVAEELIGERDQALSRTQDLRARFNALNLKTRRQEDDFRKWQDQWEQKSSSWVAERHALERRMNLTEELLRNVVEHMQSKQQPEQLPAANDDSEPANVAAEFRNIEVRHRRGLSSNSTYSIPRPLSAHSTINLANGSGTLADELRDLDDDQGPEESGGLDENLVLESSDAEQLTDLSRLLPPSPPVRSERRSSPHKRPTTILDISDPIRLLPVDSYPPRPASPSKHDSRLFTDCSVNESAGRYVKPQTVEDELNSRITDVCEVPFLCDPDENMRHELEAPNDTQQQQHQRPPSEPMNHVDTNLQTSSRYTNTATQTGGDKPSTTDSAMQTEEIRIDLRRYDSHAPLAILMEKIILSRGSTKYPLRLEDTENDAGGESTSGQESPALGERVLKPRLRAPALNRSRSANSTTSRSSRWEGISTLPAFPEEEPTEAGAKTSPKKLAQDSDHRSIATSPQSQLSPESSAVAQQRPPFPVPDRKSSRVQGRTSGKTSSGDQQDASPVKRRLRGGAPATGLRKARSATSMNQSQQDSPLRRRRANTNTETDLYDHRSQKSIASLFKFDQLAAPRPLGSHPPTTLAPAAEIRDRQLVQGIASATVGAWVWKYADRRSALCATDGNKLHKEGSRRKHWIWLSPQDRVLMWAPKKPSSGSVSVSRSKRKLQIKTVLDVKDDSPLPKPSNGMTCFDRSIIVLSPTRSVKFTATTKAQHQSWLSALSYLADTAQGPPQIPRLPFTAALPGADMILSDPHANDIITQSLVRANASPNLATGWSEDIGYAYAIESSSGMKTNDPRPGTAGSVLSVPRFPRSASARPASSGTAPLGFSLRSLAGGRRAASVQRSASLQPPPLGEVRMSAFVDATHIDDEEEEGEEQERGRRRFAEDPFRGF